MQAPKKRQSSARRDMRRAHDFLTPVQTTKCSSCGSQTRRHAICGDCGHYRGRFYPKSASANHTITRPTE